jgi:hypothetical protein
MGNQTPLLREFKRQLRAHEKQTGSHAFAAFDKLARTHHCESERLMCIVSVLRLAYSADAQVQSDPARMDSRRLRSLTEKTRWVATEWERVFRTPFGKAVLKRAASSDLDGHSAEIEYSQVPQRLLSLAADTKDIHRGSSRNRRPLYDDTIATLTQYVKLKTSDYCDSEVSQLVWFATGQRYDENTLRVWRHDHPRALERARLRLSQD